jgi:hypothetical protein
LGGFIVFVIHRFEFAAVDGNNCISKSVSSNDTGEAFATGSFKRFSVIFCAICDHFKVGCQASQQPHPFNITIGFSFQPTG